jgi:hypothetical protein
VSTESVDRASSHFYWGPSPQTPRYGDSRFVGGGVSRELSLASVSGRPSRLARAVARVGSPFTSGTSCRLRRVAPHVWHELSLASGLVGLRVSGGLSLALVWVTPYVCWRFVGPSRTTSPFHRSSGAGEALQPQRRWAG